VISLASGAFGVEVHIPEAHPATVSSFTTEASAQAWIEKHKLQIMAETLKTKGWFRRQPRQSE
jgi:hypothetical protein